MKQNFSIDVPDGYEAHITFVKKSLNSAGEPIPASWEEFCSVYPMTGKEYCFTANGFIHTGRSKGNTRLREDVGYVATEQQAMEIVALLQLLMLRKAYVGNWEPTWTDSSSKYVIYVDCDRVQIGIAKGTNHIMSFPSEALRNRFFENFKDLLEIAKPLL